MGRNHFPTLANQEEIKTKVGVPEDDALKNPITLFSGIKGILGKFEKVWTDARAVKVDSINDHVIHISTTIEEMPNAILSGMTTLSGKKIFTEDAEWTVPAGVKEVRISGCGAGGVYYAGEYILNEIVNVVPGERIAIQVGENKATLFGNYITLNKSAFGGSFPNNKLETTLTLGIAGASGAAGNRGGDNGQTDSAGSGGAGGQGGCGGAFGFGGGGGGGAGGGGAAAASAYYPNGGPGGAGGNGSGTDTTVSTEKEILIIKKSGAGGNGGAHGAAGNYTAGNGGTGGSGGNGNSTGGAGGAGGKAGTGGGGGAGGYGAGGGRAGGNGSDRGGKGGAGGNPGAGTGGILILEWGEYIV